MPGEITVLEYAYGVRNWLSMFYSSIGDYSAGTFAGFPGAAETQSNGETLAADWRPTWQVCSYKLSWA